MQMAQTGDRSHRVAVLLTEKQYQSLKQLAFRRKQADLSLPTRWGMSDLVREIVVELLTRENLPHE
jgi:hypothetical protein